MRRAAATAACCLIALLALAADAGAATLQARVVGGTDAGATDVPWQALVLPGDDLCGGSVLDAQHVLTAAHCVFDDSTHTTIDPGSVDVFAGVTSLDDLAAAQHPAVARIAVDPQYDPATYHDDAAVITLAAPGLDLSGATPAAIPLAPERSVVSPSQDLMVSGWGTTRARSPSSGQNQDPISTQLQKATLRLNTGCTVYGSDYDPALQLCAGQTGTDACQGDSGGPLAAQLGGTWTLVGIVSAGAGCAWSGFPGVYARVAAPSIHDFVALTLNLPVNQSPPTLSGTAAPGGTLTCGPGTWLNAGTFTYTIVRGDGTVLSTGPTVTLGPGDAGSQVRCTVAATDGRVVETATSAAVAVAVPPPPPAPAPPPPAPKATTAPPPADTAAPRARIVHARCSRHRACVLTIRVADPAPSAGLRAPVVRVRFRDRTTCRRHHRRVACTRAVTRRLRVRRIGTTTSFHATIHHLPAGRLRFTVVARDRAGHRQRRASRATRHLR